MARASRTPANAECDKQATLPASRVDREAPRDIEDLGRLRALFVFGQGLAAWAAQFDPRSHATLLAAGAVGVHGIDALLGFIDDNMLRYAPYASRHADERLPTPSDHEAKGARASARTSGNEKAMATAWGEAQRQLFRTLNTFRFLREHVAGNLRMEPDLSYPDEQSPESVPWGWTWEPADEDTAVVALAWFSHFPKHDLLRRGMDDAQRTHDKVAHHGRREVLHLVERMRSEQCDEGFPSIRAAIDSLPHGNKKSSAKAALKKVERMTQVLSDLVPEPVPGDPTPFGRPHQEFFAASLIEKFVDAGRGYIKHCVPLVEKRKGSLQARRKKVGRWFAVVAQYAFLASSNGLFRRFAELVAAVDVFSRYLREDVARLLDAPSASLKAGEEELQSIVRQMNALVVEPKVLRRWQEAFEGEACKKGASYYGKVIGIIVDSEGKQTTPWGRGDVLPALSRAGLITAKARRKKIDAVTDACVLMQQSGLAVQFPFDYMLGEGSPPPKRKPKGTSLYAHDGLPWIVNPLGTVLATSEVAASGKRMRASRGGRRATRGESAATGRRTTLRKVVKRSRSTSAKPNTPKAPRPASQPKAAKKWPRA